MLSIGSYQLNGRLLLAPMAGVTDLPFRRVCRQFDAALTTSEMVTADISQWSSKKSQTRLPQQLELAPRSVQIAGSEPTQMVEAARACVQMGAQIIDINMGCPAKKVCNKAAGSALLKDEPLVRDILEAVVSSVDVPVTLKFRTGWSISTRNAMRIAQIAELAGIKAIALHGRTRADAYQGHAEYETIRQVKANITIPVIANGDIQNLQDAAFILDYTHADGLMIGRAAWGQPWIFRQINEFLQHGKLFTQPDVYERLKVVQGHVQAIHDFYGTDTGIRIARKHIGWYLDRITSEPSYKKGIFAITCPDKQLAAVNETMCKIALTNIKKVA
ncbi:MAG: tRNA dihydrouridine synthase DusB [Pseudomonadota bacterium]